MKTVKVIRTFGNGSQTLGAMIVTDSEKGVEFIARTLELADKNNANNISCIIPGKYTCKYTRSNSFSKSAGHDVYTYEITNVPSRAGVRIHSANYYSQLRGCISIGSAHKDINSDGQLDVIHSGKTIEDFEFLMEHKDFELEIINTVPHI